VFLPPNCIFAASGSGDNPSCKSALKVVASAENHGDHFRGHDANINNLEAIQMFIATLETLSVAIIVNLPSQSQNFGARLM
jgi:hypothetical protein